jgi:hypothetical protein
LGFGFGVGVGVGWRFVQKGFVELSDGVTLGPTIEAPDGRICPMVWAVEKIAASNAVRRQYFIMCK